MSGTPLRNHDGRHRENKHRGEIMQFAEEYAAQRLNAFAEAERARELELRRVIAERKALAREQRAAARKIRRTVEVVAATATPVVPETVTVETILRSAPAGAADVTVTGEPAVSRESEARRELHAAVR
jgi:phage terminase Nu1 subunit (DNA packaging protein)